MFQINAGSPAGAFGDREMQVSCAMINGGYADFIGSDGHRINMRNTDMGFFVERYPHVVDMDVVRRALLENPSVIINDTDFSPKRLKFVTKL